MDTEIPKTNKIWSAIGKIAVIIGVLLAAKQLYDAFSTKKVDIAARAVPSFIYTLPTAETKKSLPAINDKVEKEKELRNDLFNCKMALFNKETHGTYIEYEIVNNGEKEAQDLRLETPFKGYYVAGNNSINVIATALTETKIEEYDGVISLGALRPKNKLYVYVWTSSNLSGYFDDYKHIASSRITYPEGSFNIDYAFNVSGFDANWVRYQYSIIIIMVAPYFIVLLYIAYRLIIRRRILVSNRSEPPAT